MNAATEVRGAAARAVQAVMAGESLDAVLAREHGPSRALLQEIVFGTLRWRGYLETRLSRLLTRPDRGLDPRVRALLEVGLYQLMFLAVPAHAAVNHTVEAADVLGIGWARALINGVLRAALRDPGLRELAPDAARLSHPAWLVDHLVADWGARAEDIFAANNVIAPLTLRVNRARTTRAQVLSTLAAAGINATYPEEPDTALSLPHRPVADIPGFAEGLVSVQDRAAQWVATWLSLAPGLRVLDACASPGGKLASALEREPTLTLVGVDRPERMAKLESTCARLGLTPRLIAGDATTPDAWWDGQPFDRILIDAPCSGTGVIRRHPDIRWLRRPSDIATLAHTQAQLLSSLWPLLAPGGLLLYVTCSVLRAENGETAARFSESTPDALPDPVSLDVGHDGHPGWQVLPGEGTMDGFYYMRWRKK